LIPEGPEPLHLILYDNITSERRGEEQGEGAGRRSMEKEHGGTARIVTKLFRNLNPQSISKM
jgi:hypothetical protein